LVLHSFPTRRSSDLSTFFMLDNDAFVFDCVCHVFNFDMKNAFGKPGQMFINHLYAFHQVLTPPGERVLSPEEFLREWSIDEIARSEEHTSELQSRSD